MTGYFKLQRRFFRHWLWDQERVYNQPEAFLDLLQFAAFAPTKRVVQGKLISLEIGELVASERFLETRWKWSRTKVRQFLELLEKDKMLDHRKDHGETVRILCNYKEYQTVNDTEKTSKDTTNQTTEEPERNQQRTSGEPNKKKDKKEESEKYSPARSLPTIDGAFNEFLDNHPTEIANDFDKLFAKINRTHPLWAKRPHPTRIEMETALANSKALFSLTDEDWDSMREFYSVAEFPEEWTAKDKGGTFWRPDSRARFIEAIGDVVNHHDRWQHCKGRGKK